MARPKASKKATQSKNNIPGFDPVAASTTNPSQSSKAGSPSVTGSTPLTASHDESTVPPVQINAPGFIERLTNTRIPTRNANEHVSTGHNHGGTETLSYGSLLDL